MGWRFRRSVTLVPGLRLNLSKSGVSASIGGPPVTRNIGPHRTTSTGSLPGTGVSMRHQTGDASPLATTQPEAATSDLLITTRYRLSDMGK